MTSGQHDNDRFDERLLAELRRLVDARKSEGTEPRARPPRKVVWRRRVVLAGTAIAAVAIAITVLVPGNTTPAYAIARAADGSVTVTFNSFQDASGLQQGLQNAGVPAMVQFLPSGQDCSQPVTVTPVPASELPVFDPVKDPNANPPIEAEGGGTQPLKLVLHSVPPNATLVIESMPTPPLSTGWTVADHVSGIQPASGRGIDVMWAAGPVKACTAVSTAAAVQAAKDRR